MKSTLILAPMAGVSDLPFRLLCKEQGADIVYTEMVSAKAVLYKNRNTKELLKTVPEEQPVILQLFGSEPETVAECARQLKDLPFQGIDLNMGCPVPKVVGNGEGSALMKKPELVYDLIAALVDAAGKPVTVKFRKGFTEDTANAPQIAQIAEKAGAAAVGVHGRTREQYYSGSADWDIIRQVKEAVSIPVYGNGDVTDPQSAKAMLEQTGCDGIMIGRGSRGNPWIFHRIKTFFETGVDEGRPSVEEVKKMILRHATMEVETKGEFTGIREMRKHVAWYTTGFPHSAHLRASVNETETLDDLKKLLEKM